MRYQIKEAMDKIAETTECDPRKLVIADAKPNQIKLTYTNEFHCEVAFTYSNGQLFLFADGRQMRM